MVKNTKTALAPVKTANTTTATLQVTNGKPLTYNCIWQFVNTHAQGQLANVQVVPLPNVKTANAVPVPFGYNGKTHRNNTSNPASNFQKIFFFCFSIMIFKLIANLLNQ